MNCSGALPALALVVSSCMLGACSYDGPGDAAVEAAASPGSEAAVTTSVVATSDDVGDRDDVAVDGGGSVDASGASDPRSAPATSVPAFELVMPRTVAVIGDSLTDSAVPQIQGALARAGVRTAVVDGLPSRKMVAGGASLPPGIDAIGEVLRQTTPDAWVVALGTNDVAAAHDPDRVEADIVTVLDAIPDGAPLVWVDVHMRDREAETGWVNMLIAHLVGQRPSSVVVGWDDYADAHDGVIADDGVHLTDSGREAFAALIADGVVAVAAG